MHVRTCRILLLPCLLSGLLALAEPGRAGQAMVVSAHPLASAAGLAVLAEGGGAADAAVAAALVLNVVEPHASGLGGGGFALWLGADGRSETIDYRECAPAALDTTVYYNPADSLHLARSEGGPAVAVPGTAAGLHRLWQRHGTLPLTRLAAPAIALARDGYPVSEALATQITERLELVMGSPALARLFLKDGLPPAAGDTLRNPELAGVIEALAAEGLDRFAARHARAIADTVQAHGGALAAEDLLGYGALVREPLRGSYRGIEFLTPPPPCTGGLAVLECLNILEPLDLTRLGEVQWRHVLCEAHKKAARDRTARSGDPAFWPTPVDSLLDKAVARQVLEGIHPDGMHFTWPALGSRSWGEQVRGGGETFPPKDHGNTTHLSVWDEHGSVISLTQTINYFFGSGLVVDGFLLNNEMADFSFDGDDRANRPVAGKRPRSSMAPMIGVRAGQPVLCLGTPGGPRIPSAVEQILVYHLDFGLDLQAAVTAPRLHPMGNTLVHETLLAPETVAGLEALGYKPYPFGELNAYFGGAHAIAVSADGRLSGGADPRRGGQVAEYSH